MLSKTRQDLSVSHFRFQSFFGFEESFGFEIFGLNLGWTAVTIIVSISVKTSERPYA
jgi:hypothetical protein